MAKRFKNSKTGSSPVVRKVALAPSLPSWVSRDWSWGLILILAVIATYSPVWWAGFIWDDDDHVTANPCIVGPLGLKEIWAISGALRSFPLVITMFWVEHALWGLNPLPYHLMNVLLHAACAVVLWRVLRCLHMPGAWLGAVLWALHPLQVESVAWISEMKNTQSCLFYLLTIFFYLRWLRNEASPGRNEWNYAFALLCAALAMASKSSTLVLPVVLALCAWWTECRLQWRYLMRLAPLLLMSLVATAITMWPQASGVAAAADPQWARTWPQRLITAGYAVWFYLGKLVWPYPLMTIYPRWVIDAGQWFSYLPMLAAIIVLFILWLKRESWPRPWLFAFSYFLVVLSPFLTLIDQPFWHYSFVEDHLQYLACIGPLALAGAGLARLADFVIPGKSWLQSSLCAGLLLIIGLLSWQRTWAYESEETLWTDTLARNPNCWAGYNSLGNVLLQKGQVDEAITQFQKALEINPNYATAEYNLGNAFLEKGHVDEAIAHYEKALRIRPNDDEANNNLGAALLLKGRVEEALSHFEEALRINPENGSAQINLAKTQPMARQAHGSK